MSTDGLINFQKRRQIAQVIRVIQALQGERYVFTPVPEIQVTPSLTLSHPLTHRLYLSSQTLSLHYLTLSHPLYSLILTLKSS